MKSFRNTTTELLLCHKCHIEIPFGDPYCSIVKNLEFRSFNAESAEEEIEILESDEITILCKNCGSYFNMQALDTILTQLPIPGQELRN